MTVDLVLAKDKHQELFRVFPNLEALDKDTEYRIVREYDWESDSIMLTVFYVEPGREKMVIRSEFQVESMTEVPLIAKDIRVHYWGPAQTTKEKA